MNNIISKISELNINGYYDGSNGYVTIWFHNSVSNKNDIVAYLKSDMSWDVREVISEDSTIMDDKELITIRHNKLGIFESNSQFDIIVRKMINALIDNSKHISDPVIKMKQILDKNSYGLLLLN